MSNNRETEPVFDRTSFRAGERVGVGAALETVDKMLHEKEIDWKMYMLLRQRMCYLTPEYVPDQDLVILLEENEVASKNFMDVSQFKLTMIRELMKLQSDGELTERQVRLLRGCMTVISANGKIAKETP